MDVPRSVVVLGALLVAVAVAVAGASVSDSPAPDPGTTGNGAAGDGSASGVGTGTGTVLTGGGASCDYAALYNGTIDAVTQVSHERGHGSGFVYRAFDNGTSYVVTNQHVLGNAQAVDVTFARGEPRRGTVVGTAPGADLGVLRVTDTPDYVGALPVRNSTPAPGTKVAAFGAPFGLRGTITQGIVSSTDRAVPTQRGFVVPNVVQTDAPINPGNSGGPLVTCQGRLVGVNTAGIPAARGENVGFAISAALVERVVPELIRTGEFDFSFLGVRTTAVTPAVADAMGLEDARGVMIVEAVPGGPAAGVLEGANRTIRADGRTLPVGGDVVLAVEGNPVRSSEDLSSYLATETSPGDRFALTVFRNGQRRTVSVELGERPTLERASRAAGPLPDPGR